MGPRAPKNEKKGDEIIRKYQNKIIKCQQDLNVFLTGSKVTYTGIWSVVESLQIFNQ